MRVLTEIVSHFQNKQAFVSRNQFFNEPVGTLDEAPNRSGYFIVHRTPEEERRAYNPSKEEVRDFLSP